MDAGLCDCCQFQKIVRSEEGLIFSLCCQSELDGRYPRYPRLPVYQCVGYEARHSDEDWVPAEGPQSAR